MSEKLEPRLDVQLPIRVFGMGADGRPFAHRAQARNISLHGAKLTGLEAQLKPGDVIGVQVGDNKARCKVIWVVDAGQAQKAEVGVKMVEGQPCPWEKEIQQTGPVTESPAAIARSEEKSSAENTRKFPRHRIPFPLEIHDPDGVGAYMRTKTADISGHGCYVETMLPLPAGKALEIAFWLDAKRVNTAAVVKSSDGGVGMGIEFIGLDEATQERLQQQIETMAAESEG
jgi:hypothetical protein